MEKVDLSTLPKARVKSTRGTFCFPKGLEFLQLTPVEPFHCLVIYPLIKIAVRVLLNAEWKRDQRVCVYFYLFIFLFHGSASITTLDLMVEHREKKKNAQKCRSSKKNKAPVAVMTQGSGNILPALKFSEQRGSKAFDI